MHAMGRDAHDWRVATPYTEDETMKTLLIALLGAGVVLVAGCNTVEGAGKDVKATGAAVEKAADKAKPN
jgi:predicted small secreted protein